MYYTRIFLFVKFSGHGESWEWLSIGYWREVRGEEGKGYNSLRSDKCHRFSNAATRELRGSQIPGSKHAIPEPHRCGSSGRKEKDTTRCAQTSVTDFLTQPPVS